MPWQFWLMALGILVMYIGAGAGTEGKTGVGVALILTGLVVAIIGGVTMPDPAMGRAGAARATIAAATAAVTDATAESDLAALERAASVAATAAASEGVGR